MELSADHAGSEEAALGIFIRIILTVRRRSGTSIWSTWKDTVRTGRSGEGSGVKLWGRKS